MVATGFNEVVNWVWLKPKKLEKCFRQQGLPGTSYKLLVGDMKDYTSMRTRTLENPMTSFTNDYLSRVDPLKHQLTAKFGKDYFVWAGPMPMIRISKPELIREAFMKMDDFKKVKFNPILDKLFPGLVSYEGLKWAKHRKLINPAFHMEKLKLMLPAFRDSCAEMIGKWEILLAETGSSELDVWPDLKKLSADVISRAAFGGSYEEGQRIFERLKKQTNLALDMIHSVYIPGLRYIPTPRNRRFKNIEEGGKQGWRSCKGRPVSNHKDWQERARKEVLQTFGDNEPDSEGLNHLKTVTMILYEVLRLYPPIIEISRRIDKNTNLGALSLPPGTVITFSILSVHQDKEFWGDDAHEFKPDRFSEGILKAAKGSNSFYPFGWGPRICIGERFAMTEAKMALSMILQRFSLGLSPSYAHAPRTVMFLQPQHGAQRMLHRL